jgi:uncharacterized protein involved in response to NO
MFFCGALQAIAAMSWWVFDLSARYMGWRDAIAWSIPPGWAHAWLILFGMFPFFIFGFLMTAGPNWLGAPRLGRAAYVPAAVAMAAGIATVFATLPWHRLAVAAGVTLHGLGWLWGLLALLRTALRHRNANVRYVLTVFIFFGLGLVQSFACALALATENFRLLPVALHGGVWFFLLPLYLGVSSRMVPFFSGRVLGPGVEYRPAWARPALLAGSFAHGALLLWAADTWLWAVDFPLAAAVVFLAYRWGLTRSMGVRLLAVLHISTAMLAIALALHGTASLARALGFDAHLGHGPLHLLVVGYFAAMAVGMVSRVSLGHSGRALEADRLTWACYLALLLTAALRAGAESMAAGEVRSAATFVAGCVWIAAFAAWSWRYVPMYFATRVDAR